MKREWTKPQLVIVIRGSAEENVLTVCKIGDLRTGPYSSDGNCTDDAGRCNSCDTFSFS